MASPKKQVRAKLIQVSKEYLNGKWRKVGFYQKPNGEVIAKAL